MSNNNGSAGVGAQLASPKGLELELTLLQGGVNQSLTKAGINVTGQTVTQASLDAELSADLALFAAVDQARAQWKAALATLKAATPTIRARFAVLKAAVVNAFGASNPQLANFGFKPKGPRKKPTSAEQALSAAQAKATREARGTVGPVKKLAIVGAAPTLIIGPSGTTVIKAPASAPPASSTPATPSTTPAAT
jgi:hypothetical protein